MSDLFLSKKSYVIASASLVLASALCCTFTFSLDPRNDNVKLLEDRSDVALCHQHRMWICKELK